MLWLLLGFRNWVFGVSEKVKDARGGGVFMWFPVHCDLTRHTHAKPLVKFISLTHSSFASISLTLCDHSVNMCWDSLFWSWCSMLWWKIVVSACPNIRYSSFEKLWIEKKWHMTHFNFIRGMMWIGKASTLRFGRARPSYSLLTNQKQLKNQTSFGKRGPACSLACSSACNPIGA